jgi:hypothetical protein
VRRSLKSVHADPLATCSVCMGHRPPISRGVCKSCRQAKIGAIFDVAHDLLMVMDFGSRDPRNENEIDSEFYFRLYCKRWIEGVKSLRMRFFRTTEAPYPVDDPDFVATLPDPVESASKQMLQLWDRNAKRFDADFEATAADSAPFQSVKIKSKDLVRWWRVSRLGQAYGLDPDDVWEHLVTGVPVRLPYMRWSLLSTPRALIIKVSNPAALDYEGLGLSAEDWLVTHFWDPPKRQQRRRRPRASQEAFRLIRTWATLCIEVLAATTPGAAVSEWDGRLGTFADEDLSWPLNGVEMYRQDKKTLMKRLAPLFDYRRRKPGQIVSPAAGL